jgi:hypothetical protein
MCGRVAHDDLEQLGLAGEVGIEGRGGDARHPRHHLHAGGGIAFTQKDAARGGEDLGLLAFGPIEDCAGKHAGTTRSMVNLTIDVQP